MNTATIATKRKLIDIRQPVFDTLSNEARRRNVSLKRLIESTLNEAARQFEEDRLNERTSMDVLGKLIGSAKPHSGQIDDVRDDRLQYLLSK
jgi:macrodomain Ter protein organizer (MatP/YcbG family)